ncbi:MAG: recombination protein RecR [Bacilli bacterium]|nr:recombination protein RecR [Bacilli bacterium]MBQ8901717.1 recombination protein RecR [Bacilli bacterium]
MIYPELLQKLINFYKKLPGIGDKSAERMALATLELKKNDVEDFSEALVDSKNNLRNCKICGHITENEICHICSNPNRNQNLICVIEDYKSVFSFEKVGNYQGVYHVLNGLISPMDGTGPEDINISSLVKRVESLENPEIILALKSSIEGETTTLYIKKIFEEKNVTISRLSYGIPIGAEIDYLDIITLDKALEDRKKISE